MKFQQIFTRRLAVKGFTKADVARNLTISEPSVSQWLSRGTTPKGENMVKLAGMLELTPAQLRGESDIPANLLFSTKEEAEAAGYKWDEPIKPPAPQPYQPEDQEPGRFLMRVNLEDCELLSIFHQLDSRDRRNFINYGIDELRRAAARKKSE